jgi:hypothetical protein
MIKGICGEKRDRENNKVKDGYICVYKDDRIDSWRVAIVDKDGCNPELILTIPSNLNRIYTTVDQDRGYGIKRGRNLEMEVR